MESVLGLVFVAAVAVRFVRGRALVRPVRRYLAAWSYAAIARHRADATYAGDQLGKAVTVLQLGTCQLRTLNGHSTFVYSVT